MEAYMSYLFERGKTMEIFTLLETLEDIMERSRSLPFTDKGIVDKEEVLEIIKEIRLKLPDELTSEIYNVLLQATLFAPTGITMQDIISSLDKSRNTIIKRLDSIPDEHLVIDTSEKPYRYKLNLTIFNK